MSLFARGTLLITSGPDHDPERKHLKIICTNPDRQGNQLIVSVCKAVGELFDRTCILQPHEHPFLWAKSYVDYRFAETIGHADLQEGVARDLFIPKPDLNGQTFLRVCRGITKTRKIDPKMRDYYLKQVDIDRAA